MISGAVNLLNLYLCIAAPLLLTFILLKGEVRQSFAFLFAGMTICLGSGYVNAFLAELLGLTAHESTIMLTPIVEELLKALPVLALVLIFLPKDNKIIFSALACGIGFAVFENCSYLLQYGANSITFILVRGFATGVMHGICTSVVGYGLSFINKQKVIAIPGVFAVLCTAVTYHAIYNILVSASDWHRYIGFTLPVFTAITIYILQRLYRRKPNSHGAFTKTV